MSSTGNVVTSARHHSVRQNHPETRCFLHSFRSARNTGSEPDVVLAVNQIQRIGKRIDVRPALVRRISAITQRKVGGHIEGSQATTFALLRRLVQARGIAGYGIARTGQIRAENAKFRGFAGPSAKRKNVIENPAVTGSELVDQVRAKRRGSPSPPHCARGFRCAGCCQRRFVPTTSASRRG